MLGRHQLGQLPQEDLTAAIEKADIEAQAQAAQRRAEEERDAVEQQEFIRKNIWKPLTVTGLGILGLWAWGKWRER